MSAKSVKLSVHVREVVGKQSTKDLRAEGSIPGVVYGSHVATRHVFLNPQEFEKAYRSAGDSTLIDLVIGEKESVPVLVQDYQRDPQTQQFTHVDFHQVRMDEAIETHLKLHFVGQSPAEKSLGGILVTNLHELAISCLPKDLIDELAVDLSSLAAFNDVIRVSDLKVPGTIKILNRADEVVALVQEPRSEKEIEEAATATAPTPLEAGAQPETPVTTEENTKTKEGE